MTPPIPDVAEEPATIEGFWEGDGGAGLGRVRLLIAPAKVGEVAGFLQISETGQNIVLSLRNAASDECTFTEGRPDYVYEVELKDNELLLRGRKDNGLRWLKVDLSQP